MSNKLRLSLIILFLFSFSLGATLNSTTKVNTITPKINRGKKTIGDHIYYSFDIKNAPYVPSFSISFADPSGNQDILLITQSIREKRNGSLKYRAEVVPFITGAINFPSFNIFNNYIEPLTVSINSVIDISASINLQASYLPFQDYSDITLFLFIVLILIIAYLSYVHFRQQRLIKESVITPEKAKNLWQELINIFSRDVSETEIKHYYFESTELLKEYISTVLKLEIRELTTYEINIYLQNKKLNGKELLQKLLNSGDPVKFAKHLPDKDELATYQKEALAFLKENEPLLESIND